MLLETYIEFTDVKTNIIFFYMITPFLFQKIY